MDIAAASVHACAISNSEVYHWGLLNGVVKQTVPTKVEGIDSIPTALSVGADQNCVVLHGNAYCWGNNHSGQIGDGTSIDRPNPVLVKF